MSSNLENEIFKVGNTVKMVLILFWKNINLPMRIIFHALRCVFVEIESVVGKEMENNFLATVFSSHDLEQTLKYFTLFLMIITESYFHWYSITMSSNTIFWRIKLSVFSDMSWFWGCPTWILNLCSGILWHFCWEYHLANEFYWVLVTDFTKKKRVNWNTHAFLISRKLRELNILQDDTLCAT